MKGFRFLIQIFTVSEKIKVYNCPNDTNVEVPKGQIEVFVSWTPPTAELLTINGSEALNFSSAGTYDEPGDYFPVGSTKVMYLYESEEANAECSFTVNVGKYVLSSTILHS